jgi:hypothetical protein
LELRTCTELQSFASQHARALQLTLAASILALAVIAALSYPVIDRMLSWLGVNSDVAISIVLAPIGGLLSLYVSWAAIWGVLGSGRWLSRVILSFLIAHLTYVLSIVVTEWLTAVRTGDPSSMEWRDALAIVAGFSYAFAGSLFVSMFLVWLLKLFRIRLQYFHDPASYSHPRKKLPQTIPLRERPDTTIASGRVSLLDMLGLITIFAVYLAAWKPIVEGWLSTNAMFGPAFAFIILLVVTASNGAVGLLAILLPLLIAMFDRWGKRTQITLQGINFLAACAAAATGGFLYQDPETVGLVVIAVVVFLANQTLLLILMRKPSARFRFRLVRV